MSEAPPILMTRRNNGLAPMSLFDSERLDKFPFDKALKVRVSRGRSSKQLRLYWGALGKVADNLDQDVTDDDLHEWIKVKLGYVKPIRLRSGEIAEVAASIALDKMEQPEFNKFFDSVKALLLEHIIPGIEMRRLLREVLKMLGENPEAPEYALNFADGLQGQEKTNATTLSKSQTTPEQKESR